MATKIEVEETAPREPLSRERILGTAMALADEGGVESLSMRKIALELGVVPMALYKHVANKDELLDGLVDVVVGEIDPPFPMPIGRRRSASGCSRRAALLRHPWASQVIESRTDPTPAVIEYMDSMIGIRGGGFSIDVTHHAMHAMGSRLLGFSQELFDDTAGDDPEAQAMMLQWMADRYPHITEMVEAIGRRRVRGRFGVRRSVRVRVRPGSHARRPRSAPNDDLTERRVPTSHQGKGSLMKVLKIGFVGTRPAQPEAMADFFGRVLGRTHSGDDMWAFRLPDGGIAEVFGPSQNDHPDRTGGRVRGRGRGGRRRGAPNGGRPDRVRSRTCGRRGAGLGPVPGARRQPLRAHRRPRCFRPPPEARRRRRQDGWSLIRTWISSSGRRSSCLA